MLALEARRTHAFANRSPAHRAHVGLFASKFLHVPAVKRAAALVDEAPRAGGSLPVMPAA